MAKKAKVNTDLKVNTIESTSASSSRNTYKVSKTSSNKKTTNKDKIQQMMKAQAKAKSEAKAKVQTVSPEYYDLPMSYNKTIVKILAQTPKKLFVYWEISEMDKQNFIDTYGNNFFDITYPLLKVYNITQNYSFEIAINDFANCWYLDIDDSQSQYSVVLCRKFKSVDNNTCLDIISSNTIETPNGHILFDQSQQTIYFKNTKNNVIYEKNIANLSFIKHISHVHKVNQVYEQLYPNSELSNKYSFDNPTSVFK